MTASSYLVVEQGTPFEKGAYIALNKPNMILGRKVNTWKPDISFDNIFVSRKHLQIYQENENFFIKDLGSKHGTKLNQEPLPAHQKVRLKDTDRITLSSNFIKLSFYISIMEDTSDLMLSEARYTPEVHVALDPVKQEVMIQNQSFIFSEKEYRCLELLIQHVEHFVPLDNIKKYVWKERTYKEEDIPDVSSMEVNTLIYRIRKKTQNYLKIENLRGKGYLLTYL